MYFENGYAESSRRGAPLSLHPMQYTTRCTLLLSIEDDTLILYVVQYSTVLSNERVIVLLVAILVQKHLDTGTYVSTTRIMPDNSVR